MNNIKQIIVIRRKYENEKGELRTLRTGKLISQACHASMAFLTNKIRNNNHDNFYSICTDANGNKFTPTYTFTSSYNDFVSLSLTKEERYWIENKFTKIVVYVDTEEELLNVYQKAIENNLTANLITDSGYTEFHGKKTNTAVAIGPHSEEKFIGVTDNLPLL